MDNIVDLWDEEEDITNDLSNIFNFKKDNDDIDHILDVIREISYLLIEDGKDFDIVIKIKR